MRANSRKITTIILALLTLVLLGIAIFIAIRLQQTSDYSVTCDPNDNVQDCPPPGFCCTCDVSVGGNQCLPEGYPNCSTYCDSLTVPTTPGQICTPGSTVDQGCGQTNACADNQRRIATCNSAGTGYTYACISAPECAPTTTTSANNCVPDKSWGDLCNQSCGANACDGDGPLSCYVCTINDADKANGCSFAKEGQAICMNGATDSAACGAITCTTCNSSTNKPLGCDCLLHSDCASGVCSIDGQCVIQDGPPTDACNVVSGKPIDCSCSTDDVCGSNYCDPTNSTCQTNPATGCTGEYNVYRCYRDVMGQGCQDALIGSAVSLSTAEGMLSATPSCAITQYDCIGTTGAGLITKTQDNWYPSCDTTTTTTSGTSSSSSSSSSGTTTTTTAYACQSMTRSPSAAEVPAGQSLSITVTDDSASSYGTAPRVFLMQGATVIATSGAPTVSQVSATRFRYVFTVAVPAGATDGAYTIRYSRTGVSTALVGAPCTEAVTVSATAPEEPSISVVKTGAAVCTVEGGVTIDYTITVSNTSNVSATLDFVRDTLPTQVTRVDQISNVVPAASIITADMIEWTGPITIGANSSLNYSYTLSFTNEDIQAFTTNQLINNVTVQFDTPTSQDNTVSFTNMEIIACLPDTAIFDEPVGIVMIGLVLVLLGVLVNRSGVIFNLFGASFGSTDATKGLIESLVPGDQGSDSFASKVIKQEERKRK